jgi:hypothetical protein
VFSVEWKEILVSVDDDEASDGCGSCSYFMFK